MQQQRQEALQELLDTEKTYVDRLRTTFKVYVLGSKSLLSENESSALFSNLEDILVANDNFLQELELRFSSAKNILIGDVFLKHIPKFSVYMVYCRNQHSSIQFLQDKMTDSGFSKFIQDSLTQPECGGLDLASFLLEPVQRLTRYPMLLKQIKKETDSESDEFKFIDLAIEECEALLTRVNISMKEGEDQYRLQKLQRRLSTSSRLSAINLDTLTTAQNRLPANLAGLTRTFSERKLLKSGIWIKLKSRRKLIVFLFSDFLMFTEAASGVTDISLLQDDDAKLKLYRVPIHLDDIWLLKEVEASKVPEAYRNAKDFRTLEIEAHDLQPLHVHINTNEYDQWIDAIASAKRRLKVSNLTDMHVAQGDILGTLKMSLLSASNLYQDGSYFCQIQNQNGTFRCSTQPAKAPNPVWNQTFAIPIDKKTGMIEFELFQYSQFDINDSLGRAQIDLDLVLNNAASLNLGTTSLHLKPSPAQLAVDISFVPKK